MKTIEQIAKALKGPLPGHEAQYRMAHAFRGSPPKAVGEVKQAAVLLLLFPKNGVWNVVFIERPSKNPLDRHSGQLSFPGGKLEPGDESLLATSLREAQEEVGVNQAKVTILGPLTELYISVSNFLVSPFVGFVEEAPIWVPQKDEVAAIIEHPLLDFRTPEIKGETQIKISPNLRLQNVPYFNLNGKVLWGATAMMMNEFLELKW